MSVFSLAWKGIWRGHRKLGTLLTALSILLAVALVVMVVRARESARKSFTRVAKGYDLVLGPTHGSALQVTLNTMFHIGDAPGTIPWEVYEQIQKDPRVSHAVPYAVGDNFKGHHVVGTTRDHFIALKDGSGIPLGDDVRGRLFKADTFEAVIGSQVASRHKIRLGYQFSVSHGVGSGGMEHAERWSVVGIMRPTGTPADRALFIPLETFYEVESHQDEADNIRKRRAAQDQNGEEDDDDPPPATDDEDPPETAPSNGGGHTHSHGDGSDHSVHGLSAVGVRCYSPVHRFEIRKEFITDREAAQAVIPVDQVGELLRIIEKVDVVFEGVAYLVMVIAAVSILVGLYNTIQGRRREIAILRALGARPGHVFTVIVLESLFICLLGGLAGLCAGNLVLVGVADALVERYGVDIQFTIGGLEAQVMALLLVVGLAAGALPAWRGLRTPVAENLYPVD